MKTVLANLGLYETHLTQERKKHDFCNFHMTINYILLFWCWHFWNKQDEIWKEKNLTPPTLKKTWNIITFENPTPKSLSQIFKVSWNFVRYSLNCIFILCSVLQKVAWLKDIKFRSKMWIEKQNKTMTVIWNTKSTASNLLIVPIEVYWIAWIRWWINVAFYFKIVICHVKLRVIYEKHYSNF